MLYHIVHKNKIIYKDAKKSLHFEGNYNELCP
jgi:hypothetical protein